MSKTKNAGANLSIEFLAKPATYSLANGKGEHGQSLKIVCVSLFYCDVGLNARHGCTLMNRNVLWVVAEHPMSEPLLGHSTHSTHSDGTQKNFSVLLQACFTATSTYQNLQNLIQKRQETKIIALFQQKRSLQR